MKFRTSIFAVSFSLLIFSCQENNKKSEDVITPTETRSTMEYNKNQLDSIPETENSSHDFKGSGGEPFWSVEISDKQVIFKSPDKNYEFISTTVNNVDTSGSTITFNSENNNEKIRVQLVQEECIDGMNGKKNTHKVEVYITGNEKMDPKTYKGCGSFIRN